MTRPSTPSSLTARCRPSFASWLKPRSFRPPMSVTTPTLIFLPAACVEVVEPPPAAESDAESSSPHAAIANTSPARPIARIDLDIPFLNTAAPPSAAESRSGLNGRPCRRGNLQASQEVRLERVVGERRIERRPGHVHQLPIAEAHALTGDVVLPADRGREVRWVVRA